MVSTTTLRIHPKMTVGLSGMIPGGVSLEDFCAVTKMNPIDSREFLNQLLKNQIGTKQDGNYYFEDGDKLKTAIVLLEHGFPIDEISIALNWRDFEGLTAEVLFSKDFAVIKNMILTKPRMEIDVIGIRLGVALLIDCKHWKRSSRSSLTNAVHKQIERTKKYVEKTPGSSAVPIIVTLYQDEINFIENVPIVPIFKFASFVDEFYGNLDKMKTIGTN